MKKIYLFLIASFLFSSVGFAAAGGGKDKAKKAQSQTTVNSCPGKQCSKKKGS
jgi:hypothetical protein